MTLVLLLLLLSLCKTLLSRCLVLIRYSLRRTSLPAVTTIWVFIYKFDPYSYLIKYKAQLVIYSNLHTSIYNNTYAATLILRTFCSLMAIAAAHDLETM